MTQGLRARVSGVGLIAPGIAGWEQGRQILRGQEPWQSRPLVVPAANFMPAAERRRAGKAIRLALACGHEAVADSGCSPDDLASVFASADVDAENTHQICIALNEAEPNLSPTRFHNSVQNAVSGYWTILTGSRAPTTMVMGADEVLAMGLLEALAQVATSGRPVLLVVFDIPMPAPLYATHPIEGGGALALVLDVASGEGPTIRARLVRDGAGSSPAAGSEAGSEAGCEVGSEAGCEPGYVKGSGDLAAGSGSVGRLACSIDSLQALRGMHPVGPALPLLTQLARWGPSGQSSQSGRSGQAVSGDPLAAAGSCGPHGAAKLKFDRYHCLEVAIDYEARADADA